MWLKNRRLTTSNSAPAPRGIRMRVVAAATAALLVAVFAVFSSSNYYINELQRSTVEAAVRLAEEQARLLARDVMQIMSTEGDSDLAKPITRERLRPMTEVVFRINKEVKWAGIFDAKGNHVLIRGATDGTQATELANGTRTDTVRLPDGGLGEIAISSSTPGTREVRESIISNGKTIGEVRLRVAETPAFRAIEQTSQKITRSLAVQTALLLLFLIAVFWYVYRTFLREILLTRENDRLDRMAYVGTLASGLAHEIRNPLSAMNVNLQVLREELNDPAGNAANTEQLAKRVQGEVEHLNATLSSFLDFALPNRDQWEVFSLREIVEHLIESHAALMAKAGIENVTHLAAEGTCIVRGSRRMLLQAVRNVIVNAIQIMAPEVRKVLTVELHADGGNVVLSVRDTGPGLPAGMDEKIFDVFFSTRNGGSGFGLAIARKVLEEHGGTIRAMNNTEARGATFTISIPVARTETEPSSAALRTETATRRSAESIATHRNTEQA